MMGTISTIEGLVQTMMAAITSPALNTNLTDEPRKLQKLPAFTQEYAGWSDAGYTEVGSITIRYRWIHRFYTALHDPVKAQQDIKNFSESYLAALKADPDLGNYVMRTGAETGEPMILLVRPKPQMILEIDFWAEVEED